MPHGHAAAVKALACVMLPVRGFSERYGYARAQPLMKGGEVDAYS